MSFRSKLSCLLAVSACSCLFACTSLGEINETSSYPRHWPAISKQLMREGCPDLTGSFENEAFEVVPDDNVDIPESLTSILGRMSAAAYPPSRVSDSVREAKVWRVPADAGIVTMVQSRDSLSISFGNDTPGATGLTFRQTHAPLMEVRLDDVYVCEDYETVPQLRFMIEVDMVASGAPFLGAGLARTIVSLYRAFDGSLVARWNRQSGGFLVMAPYIGNESTWLRFRPIPLSNK